VHLYGRGAAVIELGGLVWTYSTALEFWQHAARDGHRFEHLSQSAIRDYCVDRLGGARFGIVGNASGWRGRAVNDPIAPVRTS
jgi:hypothetical protein